MSSQIEETFAAPVGKYLVDSYEDWALGEGVPIYRGNNVSLNALETQLWPRFGLRGAMCHLDGRCGFLTVFVMDIDAAFSAPQKHLYEEICYVLRGEGETEIVSGDGSQRTITWKKGCLFSAPMNAQYRHRSKGGARIVCFNDLRYLMNLYRNERFLFASPNAFPERGEGEIICGLASLPVGEALWPNERTTALSLANGSIGVDIVEIESGAYGQARRQAFGSLVLAIAGEGMSLSWTDYDEPASEVRWVEGELVSPVSLSFHQHFNIGAAPARFLRIEFGSKDYPILRPRAFAYGEKSVYASGAAQIPYAGEHPQIRQSWLHLLRARGVASRMPAPQIEA